MSRSIQREIALQIMYLRREAQVEINKRLAPLDASAPYYSILFRLANDEDVPQAELASDAALDPAGVSRLITRMVREGLVESYPDPDDRRQRRVRITRAGTELERSLAPVVDAAVEEMSGGLTESEQGALLRLLRKAAEAVATQR